jgi:acyl-CoA synthetase (AMP-forming)/AMP-acid ligase II/acyl carrier protein
MLSMFRYLVWAVGRLVLSLRYRVRAHGMEQLCGARGPVLILPNHPGYIDPPLVLSVLWPVLRPRPLAFEGNFKNPVVWPLMKLLNAVPVPDLEQASMQARAQARQAVQTVIEALRKGENVIMWPSGHLQHNGTERLGGARALTDILQAVPEAEVVLVRTRGVWGSKLSYAPTGKHPRLGRGLLAGFGWLLANLLLFMPRRKVNITVERIDRSKLPELRREAINPWFEAWFNAGGPEEPAYVPYHFLFGPRTFEFPKVTGLAEADLSQVKPETREEVNHMIADKLGRPLTEAEQKPETTFDQLGLDSLDRMELTLAVEHRFGFSADQVPTTVGQLWVLAQGLVERGPTRPPPPEWFRPPSQTGLLEIKGDTIAEAFVARALAAPKDVAAADDLAGVLTYERLLVGALALSRRFAALPAPNIGLMLPASVACDLALLGLELAGKLPVVLNWTTGPAYLAHAARTMGLTHVVTSRQFLDRSGVTVEGVQYLLLEEVGKGIGTWEKLRTLLLVRWRPGSVRARIPQVSPDQPAVVLFTSGSEKAPKAVPLTHQNILGDMRAGVPFLGLRREDSVLGFLPAFHSFGLTVTGLLPLLGGIRVVHHPDPTDASGLARKIAAYRPTLVMGTPTFMSYIIDRAGPDDLESLRLIVVGAEKCPPVLLERCARVAPGAHLLEGYGITECSPVVSVNTPRANRPGTVGRPLPGVEVRAVEVESGEPVGPNRLGMLLVSGPTVFPGYLAYDGPSPFRELDGKRWYVTGDLAAIDADGFIHFSARLKRFLKAGGEMISLPALEEPFARTYPPTSEGPRVAVEGVETEEGRRIVLFSTEPITLREANARLLEEGFRGVMRLDEVRRVDKVPVLGTGKTDYKVLRALLTSPERAAEGAAR